MILGHGLCSTSILAGRTVTICGPLHRQGGYHGGKDLRERPYCLFRVRVDARPVLLR